MLHNRHKLHMSILHVLYILSQLDCKLSIIIEFRAYDLIALFVSINLFANPGTKMYFINGHWLFFCISHCPLFHPLLIIPLIMINVPYNRSIIRTQLTEIAVWIRFQLWITITMLNLILIDKPGCKPGYK